MRRITADDQAIVFQLTKREHETFVRLLNTYPVVPPAHHTLGQTKEPRIIESQRLLDEAVSEQRAAHKRHLDLWLNAPERFRFPKKGGCHFTLQRADSEWLLQVLNDVRVGHWLLLGSPETGWPNVFKMDPGLLPMWLAMENCGYVQMSILHALTG